MRWIGLMLLACAGTADAMTWVVQQDGSGDYTTLTDAVAAASDGDVIQVGPGEYEEINVTVGVGLRIESIAGPEATVLTSTDRFFFFNTAHVSEVEGFRFERCLKRAMLVRNAAEVTVRDCQFVSNVAPNAGGAINVRAGAKLVVDGCTFRSNYAPTEGGAITAADGATLTLLDSTFLDNTAEVISGAVEVQDSTVDIDRCVFARNRTFDTTRSGAPGAVHVWRSQGEITNSTFHRNESSSDRASVLINTSPGSIVTHNVFSEDQNGAGLRIQLGVATHNCNLFWNNQTGSVTGVLPDPTEFDADPGFCDAELDDYRILYSSPAAPAQSSCGLLGAKEPGCALGEPRLAADRVSGDSGAIVAVPIDLQLIAPAKRGDPNRIGGIEIELSWDAAFGTVESVDATSVLEGWLVETNVGSGQLSIAAAGVDPIAAGFERDDLFILQFRIDGTEGATNLQFPRSDLFDADSQLVSHTIRAGRVEVTCAKGDVIEDGAINSGDAVRTLQFVAELRVPTPLEFCRADRDLDGAITPGDAVSILREVVGLDKFAATAREAPGFSTEGNALIVEPQAFGLAVELTWDPHRVTYQGLESGAGLWLVNDAAPGRLVIAAAHGSELAPVRVEFDATQLATVRVNRAVNYGPTGRPQATASSTEIELHAAPRPELAFSVHPNPFNPRAELRFSLPTETTAGARVVDARGRVVRRYPRRSWSTGRHVVHFDGRDDAGRALASGVYLFVLETDAGEIVRKATLVK